MQRLGRADTIEFENSNVAYERVLSEPYTVLFPPSRSPEREELFKWVGPLIPEKIALFARKDSGLVSQRSATQGPEALKFGRVDLWLNSNITMKQLALTANVDPELFEPVFVIKEIPSYLAYAKSVPDEVVNQR
jgi:hypothetical protein